MSDDTSAHSMAVLIAQHLKQEKARAETFEVREEIERCRLAGIPDKWSPGFARVDLVASEGSVVAAIGDMVDSRAGMVLIHRAPRDNRAAKTYCIPRGAVKLITLIPGTIAIRVGDDLEWKTPVLPEAIA